MKYKEIIKGVKSTMKIKFSDPIQARRKFLTEKGENKV